MSKTFLALLLALSVPALYGQSTGKQSEYANPPSTKGSGTSRAQVKAEERAAGSMGTKQTESSDPAMRRKGAAAANDGAPVNDPYAQSRNEKAEAKKVYKEGKGKDRAQYQHAKKESGSKLKATGEHSETSKYLDVPK